MKKIDYRFAGFKVTYQSNNINHLILITQNDVAASIHYPVLSISTDVSISYSKDNNYFDLLITLNDYDSYYELNFSIGMDPNIDEQINILAQAIDKNLVTELWVAYPKDNLIVPYGAAMALSYH
jgi:hypothetical protein